MNTHSHLLGELAKARRHDLLRTAARERMARSLSIETPSPQRRSLRRPTTTVITTGIQRSSGQPANCGPCC